LNDLFIHLENGTVLSNKKAYLFRAVKNADTNYHKAQMANLWHIDNEEETNQQSIA